MKSILELESEIMQYVKYQTIGTSASYPRTLQIDEHGMFYRSQNRYRYNMYQEGIFSTEPDIESDLTFIWYTEANGLKINLVRYDYNGNPFTKDRIVAPFGMSEEEHFQYSLLNKIVSYELYTAIIEMMTKLQKVYDEYPAFAKL